MGGLIGFLELSVMKDSANGAAPGDFVGDFRNGALDFGWDNFDEDAKLSKRAIELNNGRAAQMGLLGLMVHEKLNRGRNCCRPSHHRCSSINKQLLHSL